MAAENITTPETEITKIKNPQASLQIFYRFLYPYPSLWIFLLEITKIWQKSQDLVHRFFSSDLKDPQAGMDFPMDFWLF